MRNKVLVALALVTFALTIGIVGGLDTARIGVPLGICCAVLSEAASAFCLWKAGVLK